MHLQSSFELPTQPELPQPLENILRTKSEGNAFCALAILQSLIDNNLISPSPTATAVTPLATPSPSSEFIRNTSASSVSSPAAAENISSRKSLDLVSQLPSSSPSSSQTPSPLSTPTSSQTDLSQPPITPRQQQPLAPPVLRFDLDQIGQFEGVNNPLEKLITSRLDRLSPVHALLLRVCSCMSTDVRLDLLADVAPVSLTKEELAKELEVLEKAELLCAKTEDGTRTYAFCQNIVMQVCNRSEGDCKKKKE